MIPNLFSQPHRNEQHLLRRSVHRSVTLLDKCKKAKNILAESLAGKGFCCKFIPATKPDSNAESTYLFNNHYISAAGGSFPLLGSGFVAIPCLRFFYFPAGYFLTSNSDKS